MIGAGMVVVTLNSNTWSMLQSLRGLSGIVYMRAAPNGVAVDGPAMHWVSSGVKEEPDSKHSQENEHQHC